MTHVEDFERVRHAQMRWNTPLDEDHCELLLRRLDLGAATSVVDLGCGWGELLLRAVATADTASGEYQCTGVGVDSDAVPLDRGRGLAAERGLHDRVTFVARPATEWSEPADRVICVGASHAFGGTDQTLDRLARIVRPGGRLLLGDACWTSPPPRTADELFPEVRGLGEVVTQALAFGWRVLHLSTADQREWDDFESTWRAGRQIWLLDHPTDEQASAAQAELDSRLIEYVTTYRSALQFCYLVLARPQLDDRPLKEHRAER